jgi:hypothetical protein
VSVIRGAVYEFPAVTERRVERPAFALPFDAVTLYDPVAMPLSST